MEIINNTFKLSDGTIVGCNFYDTNGTQRYRSVNEALYKKVDGCIIIYDITNKNSFDEIENYFIPKIKEKCKENIPVLIIGNKIDMNDNRKVSTEEGKELASKYGFIFNETSSIENLNINDIFRIIIEITNNYCIKNREENENNNPIRIEHQIEQRRCFNCC